MPRCARSAAFVRASLVAWTVLGARIAVADMGPKPRISITLVGIPIVPVIERTEPSRGYFDWQSSCNYENVALLFCQDAACARWRPMRDSGPARFCCSHAVLPGVAGLVQKKAGPALCGGLAYGFAEWLRLRVEVDGRTVLSNPFRYERGWMQAAFEARFVDGRLTVERSSVGAAPEPSAPPDAPAAAPAPHATGKPLAVSRGVGRLPSPRFDADYGLLEIPDAAGEVSIDGVPCGRAPMTVKLRDGTYRVALRANGRVREGRYRVQRAARLVAQIGDGATVDWSDPPAPRYEMRARWTWAGAPLGSEAAERPAQAVDAVLRSCADAFYPDPRAGVGRLAARVTVDREGAILSMKIDPATTLRDPKLHACVLRRLENEAWRAAAGESAGTLTVTVARPEPKR